MVLAQMHRSRRRRSALYKRPGDGPSGFCASRLALPRAASRIRIPRCCEELPIPERRRARGEYLSIRQRQLVRERPRAVRSAATPGRPQVPGPRQEGSLRQSGAEPPVAPVPGTHPCSDSVPRSIGEDRRSPRVLRGSPGTGSSTPSSSSTCREPPSADGAGSNPYRSPAAPSDQADGCRSPRCHRDRRPERNAGRASPPLAAGSSPPRSRHPDRSRDGSPVAGAPESRPRGSP